METLLIVMKMDSKMLLLGPQILDPDPPASHEVTCLTSILCVSHADTILEVMISLSEFMTFILPPTMFLSGHSNRLFFCLLTSCDN